MTNKQIKQLDHPDIPSMIPAQLLERIQETEATTEATIAQNPEQKKIAVFDLDNTLLEGDIGDALFVQLKKDQLKQPLKIDNKTIPLTWAEYLDILKEKGKKYAYQLVIEVMAGIPVSTIIETTRQIMAMNTSTIRLETENIEVPVPKPNPIMKALVPYLESLGYSIHVVSASNHYSVQYVATTFFGIPSGNITGMKPKLYSHPTHGDIIDTGIVGPVTVEEGKAEAYRQTISTIPPLITAGDSSTDFQILNLVDPNGLCIWVSEHHQTDDKNYAYLKNNFQHPDTLYFLQR